MNQTTMDTLAKATKSVPITPLGVETDVMINGESGGLRDYVETLADALDAQYQVQHPVQNKEGNDISLFQMMMAYYMTLLMYRVLYVRREESKAFDYRMDNLCLAITPYISTLFECIGKVDSVDKGFVLMPNIQGVVPLDERTMREYSRRISALLNTLGITYVKELPRDRNGSIELMTMQVIGDVVMNESRDESHAVYALMAATLNLKQVEAVVAARVSYGDVRLLKRILPSVVDYECAHR